MMVTGADTMVEPNWALPDKRVETPAYWRQDHPEFAGHPLIEALRPLPDDDVLPALVGNYPAVEPTGRDLLPRVRRNRPIVVLGQLRVALQTHLFVLDRFDLLLRLGYLGHLRNPHTDPSFWQETKAVAEQIPHAC